MITITKYLISTTLVWDYPAQIIPCFKLWLHLVFAKRFVWCYFVALIKTWIRMVYKAYVIITRKYTPYLDNKIYHQNVKNIQKYHPNRIHLLIRSFIHVGKWVNVNKKLIMTSKEEISKGKNKRVPSHQLLFNRFKNIKKITQ